MSSGTFGRRATALIDTLVESPRDVVSQDHRLPAMDDRHNKVFGTPPSDACCRDRTAAYAVVNNQDGHVAAVCANVRGKDELWLPGGGVLDGETAEQAIAREVREELGRHIRLDRRLGQALQYFFAGDEGCWYKMVAHFFAAQFSEEVASAGEFELHWIDLTNRESEFFHECHIWAAIEVRGHARE